MTQHAFKTGVPLIALMGFLMIGVAYGGDKPKAASPAATPKATITLEKAITLAKEAMLGRVIEAELEEEDGKSVYEVKIVAVGGKTYEFTIDAESGKVLETEEKD